MKRISNLTILLVCVLLPLKAQSTLEQLYVNMPDMLNPAMSKKQRMEQIEYYKAGSDSVANRFNNQVYVRAFDEQNGYMKIQTTDISAMEIKYFINGNDTVVGVIKTVCTPICQSVVNFYTTAWHKRSDIKFSMPKAVEWLDPEMMKQTTENTEIARKLLDVSFISLSFSPDQNEILALNHSLDYLSEQDREIVAPLLREEPIIFRIDNKEWLRVVND